MTIFYNPKTKNKFIKASIPIRGRTIARLNKKPVMMYDIRIMPYMAFILPAMNTNGNYANENKH